MSEAHSAFTTRNPAYVPKPFVLPDVMRQASVALLTIVLFGRLTGWAMISAYRCKRLGPMSGSIAA